MALAEPRFPGLDVEVSEHCGKQFPTRQYVRRLDNDDFYSECESLAVAMIATVKACQWPARAARRCRDTKRYGILQSLASRRKFSKLFLSAVN